MLPPGLEPRERCGGQESVLGARTVAIDQGRSYVFSLLSADNDDFIQNQ